MKSIRNNVFETNSSSAHSITFGNFKVDKKLIEKTIVLKVEGGEFGWEFETWETPQDKFSYFLSAFAISMYMKQRQACAKRFVSEDSHYYDWWISDDTKYEGDKCGRCPFDIFQEVGEEYATRLKDILRELKNNGIALMGSDGFALEEDEFFDELDKMYSEEAWKKDSTLNLPFNAGYIDHQSAPTEDGDCASLANFLPQEVVGFVFGSGYIQGGNDNC